MNLNQQYALEAIIDRPLTVEERAIIDPYLMTRSDGLIAEILSVGRVKRIPTEIGNGTILEVLGLTSGNALLDAINSVPEFRHVKPMVEQGRLRLDSALVIATLQSLVGTLLTSEQAHALLARAEVPDHINPAVVSAALNSIGA